MRDAGCSADWKADGENTIQSFAIRISRRTRRIADLLPSAGVEKRSETLEPLDQHPVGDLRGFRYNPGDPTTRKREMGIRIEDMTVRSTYGATGPRDQAPV